MSDKGSRDQLKFSRNVDCLSEISSRCLDVKELEVSEELSRSEGEIIASCPLRRLIGRYVDAA